jgi:hypothetical protein
VVLREVSFLAFDSENGRPTASISGSPVDVADFLSIWMKNNKDGVSLADQLGVHYWTSGTDADEE